MRPTRRPHASSLALLAVLASLATLLIQSLAAGPAAHAQSPSPGVRAQMEALQAEKLSRTPALQKLDSRLAIEHRRQIDPAFAAAVPMLRRGFELGDDGRVLVDLRADVGSRTAPALEGLVHELGGEVVSSHPRWSRLRVRLDIPGLARIAERSEVRWIRPADPWMVQGLPAPRRGPAGKMINTTEGDVAHAADVARVEFSVDGGGVTACAMSDSVDALADVQASGDLPPGVTVLAGQSGNPGTSEGTALLEILHDLAPGADLGFATGIGGEAQMAQNILDLRDVVGCDVIVDDILYLSESVFQDGVIAQAITDVVASGVFYVTSAGNSGNLDAGESGVFEGDYSGAALPTPLVGAGNSAHDFGAGDVGNEVTTDSPFFFTLQWSDPSAASDNDYDLYLLDAGLANVLAASTSTQNGTQDPLEAIDTTAADDTGNHLVIVQFDGVARHLHLNTHRGRLEHGTDGQIFGHPGAESALTVAAVDVATAGGGQFTGGAANPVEFFSSDGPRRIFFEADGTPVGAAAGAGPSNKGGQTSAVRQKPDVAAADGVSTATPGFNPFFGTSASAPHVAGMSALFEDLFPGLPVQHAFDVFRTATLDIDAPGVDRNSGSGIPMADEILSPQPIFSDGFESGDLSAWTSSTP